MCFIPYLCEENFWNDMHHIHIVYSTSILFHTSLSTVAITLNKITYTYKVQHHSQTLSDWIMSHYRFILASYESFTFACHNSYSSNMGNWWKAYHCNDATCLHRQLWEPLQEKNTFHKTYVPPIWRLEHVEYVYLKLGDATAYSQSVLQTMLRQRNVMLGYSCN